MWHPFVGSFWPGAAPGAEEGWGMVMRNYILPAARLVCCACRQGSEQGSIFAQAQLNSTAAEPELHQDCFRAAPYKSCRLAVIAAGLHLVPVPENTLGMCVNCSTKVSFSEGAPLCCLQHHSDSQSWQQPQHPAADTIPHRCHNPKNPAIIKILLNSTWARWFTFSASFKFDKSKSNWKQELYWETPSGARTEVRVQIWIWHFKEDFYRLLTYIFVF